MRFPWLRWLLRLRRFQRLPASSRNSFCAIDVFFGDEAYRFLDEQRRAHRTIIAAPGLAAFFAVVRVQVLWRHVHDVFVAMHHAAFPEFSLGRDEEQFIAGGAGPIDRLVP